MDNNHSSFCPRCDLHPRLSIVKNEVRIICKCGYTSLMNLSDYLSSLPSHPPTKPPSTEFSIVKNRIIDAQQHLSTYFKSLKDGIINKLLQKIAQINSAYETSITTNTNILSLITLLIENYNGSSIMRNNIINNSSFHIYNCDDELSFTSIIKFFNEYNIISSREFTIDKLTCERTINEHSASVNSLLLLNDGTHIASCSLDKSIKIFDCANDYNCELTIKGHTDKIVSICQLDEGNIVSCSNDKSIKIFLKTISDAHDDSINKVITLPNNRVASCSNDNTIKIWKSSPPYQNEPLAVLKGHNGKVKSMIFIKNRDIIVAGDTDGKLRLWSMSTYQCVSVIDNVKCCYRNALYQFDDDRVIVGHKNGLYVVNIDKCIIEDELKDEDLGYVTCFLKLRDNYSIICGCDEGKFCVYDIFSREHFTIPDKHDKDITDLIRIDDDTFVSCSFDSTIKVWKY